MKILKIAEGVTSNVFWVEEGKAYTPSLNTGILNGDTAVHFCALRKGGFVYHTRHYMKGALLRSDEAFLKNSFQEIILIQNLGENSGERQNRCTSLTKTIKIVYGVGSR